MDELSDFSADRTVTQSDRQTAGEDNLRLSSPMPDGHGLLVRQIGSPIGLQRYQKACLIGLGLNKIRRSRTLPDTPQVRGMIRKVRHLVQVQEIPGAPDVP